MAWWQYVLLGAGGGALTEALMMLKWVIVWQNARRKANGQLRSALPGWSRYIDVPVHAWLLVIRMPMGAATAWLFGATGQISGPYAALAFGFAAPAVLAQLGSFPALSAATRSGVNREPAPEPVKGVGPA